MSRRRLFLHGQAPLTGQTCVPTGDDDSTDRAW